jgi:hypothetical protein
MKSALLTTAALLTVFALPALAVAGTVAGCETVAVEGSNYTVKADPTCVFAGQPQGQTRGFVRVSLDADNDPSTPDVPGLGISDAPGAGIPLN